RTRNQLIGSAFSGYFLERERAAEGVRLTFKQGAVTNYVLTLEAANGSRVPVSFNAAVFKDTSGRVRGIFASARDIAAQKGLEAQLQASQQYTRTLIESNIDALMTTDPLGLITDVNQQMELLTGRAREELVGSPFKSYFTDPARAEEGIRLVVRSGKVTNYELTALTKDGAETVVSYNAVTFKDANGELQGVFAAARDITEQKKLERQLRESQSYNRGLIEASLDGLITVDPSGTITDVNDRMCQMSGYERGELVGSPFADYFTEPERARSGVQQTFDAGFVTEYALTLIARTRRQLQVSFNASVFKDSAGAVRGLRARPRHHRARPPGRAASRAADLPARPHRIVGRWPRHRRSGRVHHRRERADVPDDRLPARGARGQRVQEAVHGARARRDRREADLRRGRGDQLRARAALQGRPQGDGLV